MRHLLTAFLMVWLAPPLAAQGPVGEDSFNTNTCETPARDNKRCRPVRWGYADCPGQPKVACDTCYGRNGIFAYVLRTNRTYKLSSVCEHLNECPPDEVFWSVSDPDVAEAMEDAGGECEPQGRVLICQGVDPDRYRTPGSGPGPTRQTPEEKAAAEILRQWKAGPAITGRVSYAATEFGKGRLHAVRSRGPIRVVVSAGSNVDEFLEANPGYTGGINGTFFKPGVTPLEPGGPVVSGGKPVIRRTMQGSKKPVPVPRSFLGSRDGGFFIQDLPADELAPFAQQVKNLKAKEGIGGLGRLLLQGKDVRNTIAVAQQKLDNSQVGDNPDARTAAGIASDGSLVLLVQEGDDRTGVGAGAGQLARIFQGLGVGDAVLLDGGSSTQISIPGRGIRGGSRVKLPTAILF